MSCLWASIFETYSQLTNVSLDRDPVVSLFSVIPEGIDLSKRMYLTLPDIYNFCIRKMINAQIFIYNSRGLLRNSLMFGVYLLNM